MKRKALQALSLLLIAALSVCLLSACSAAKNARNDSAEAMMPEATMMTTAAYTVSYVENDYGYEEGMTVMDYVEVAGNLYTPQDNRKMIRTADLTLESEDYDASLQVIQAEIEATGAYIEASSSNGYSEYYSRYMMMTVRVPADRFDEFMAAKDTFGVVTGSSVSQEDVTLAYADMEARLETLNTKKERLLALLEDAAKMADIIELENALADTIAEIESYTSGLNQMNNRIDYCTVSIELQEVYHATPVAATPKSLGERICQRFEQSIEGVREFGEELLVFLLGASPVLLILAVVVLAVVLICVKSSRHRRKKAEAAMEKRRTEMEKIQGEAENNKM